MIVKMASEPLQQHAITTSVISDLNSFQELKPFWESMNVDPMNGYQWNHAWWTAFQSTGKLHSIEWNDGGEICGVAPFYLDRWFGVERLRFIGSGKTCTDYVDLIARPEDQQQLTESLANHLLQQQFDVIELECTRDDVLSLEIVDALSTQYHVYCRDEDPSWSLELPEHWEDFIEQAHRGLRRKIRKATKGIETGRFQIKSTAKGLSVASALSTFKELHQLRLNAKSQPGIFSDPKFEAFLFDVLNRLCGNGQAEIVQLWEDGVCIGTQVYLVAKSGFQFYQSGISPAHMKSEPGHVLFAAMMKRGIELGHREFDFLRGNEPYKEFWGATVRPLKKFRLVSRRMLPSTIARLVESSKALRAGASKAVSELRKKRVNTP